MTSTIKEAVKAALDEWTQQRRDEEEPITTSLIEDAWAGAIEDLVQEAIAEWTEDNFDGIQDEAEEDADA